MKVFALALVMSILSVSSSANASIESFRDAYRKLGRDGAPISIYEIQAHSSRSWNDQRPCFSSLEDRCVDVFQDLFVNAVSTDVIDGPIYAKSVYETIAAHPNAFTPEQLIFAQNSLFEMRSRRGKLPIQTAIAFFAHNPYTSEFSQLMATGARGLAALRKASPNVADSDDKATLALRSAREGRLSAQQAQSAALAQQRQVAYDDAIARIRARNAARDAAAEAEEEAEPDPVVTALMGLLNNEVVARARSQGSGGYRPPSVSGTPSYAAPRPTYSAPQANSPVSQGNGGGSYYNQQPTWTASDGGSASTGKMYTSANQCVSFDPAGWISNSCNVGIEVAFCFIGAPTDSSAYQAFNCGSNKRGQAGVPASGRAFVAAVRSGSISYFACEKPGLPLNTSSDLTGIRARGCR